VAKCRIDIFRLRGGTGSTCHVLVIYAEYCRVFRAYSVSVSFTLITIMHLFWQRTVRFFPFYFG